MGAIHPDSTGRVKDRLRTPSLRAAALIGGALVLASGGSTAPATATTGAAARSKVVKVSMKNNRFHPHRIVVRRGQRIRWINNDAVAHTVASADLHIASDAIEPGRRFSYRARRVGTFDYFCTIHAGQTGKIVVRPRRHKRRS